MNILFVILPVFSVAKDKNKESSSVESTYGLMGKLSTADMGVLDLPLINGIMYFQNGIIYFVHLARILSVVLGLVGIIFCCFKL